MTPLEPNDSPAIRNRPKSNPSVMTNTRQSRLFPSRVVSIPSATGSLRPDDHNQPSPVHPPLLSATPHDDLGKIPKNIILNVDCAHFCHRSVSPPKSTKPQAHGPRRQNATNAREGRFRRPERRAVCLSRLERSKCCEHGTLDTPLAAK